MKELEETKCEVRNVINFELPLWDQVDGTESQDEATTDGSKESKFSQTAGGYLNADCKYAWLSYGTRLVVVDVRFGKCISCQNFPSKVTSVSSFPAEPGQVPLLLVGLDNNAIRIKDSVGHLCIFDCCSSTILTTIQVPAGVEKACIIHGGADWEEFHEKRPDTVLSGNTGLIFAALRNLQHVVIDIQRPLWEDAYLDGKSITAKLEFVNDTPTKSISNKNKKEPTHLAYDLMDKEIEQYVGFDRDDFEATPLYDESLCSVLLSSTKIGCLITGCLGRVIIWQNDGSIGWISPPFDENAYVTHVALLEPSDDPRPFYYLWIACQNDLDDSSAVLRMYAMLFNKKHSDKSGESSLYFNLESEPSLKFELELEQGERIHSLLPVERENLRESADSCSRRGEDSLLLIATDERMLLFDLNRWYKEQMPRTMAECRNPNSVMASYRNKYEEFERKSGTICSSYISRSLREFSTKGPTSPEELFYPNSLTLEWVDLAVDSLTFWLARGAQSELLREITIAGPIVLVKPSETYRRCLTVGLVPFDTVPQDYPLNAEKSVQREMLLSLCLEQRWANFLIRCATEWSDGSAAYIYPEFLRWGVQRASELKLITDRLCVSLFDQSGANIGETEVKTLRFCGQQLECLTTVVSKLPNPESDLEKQRRALTRISTYLQVLLWFYDVGLLPENQDMEDEGNLPQIPLSMKIPYPKDKLVELYKKKRRSGTDNEEIDCLFIDHLLSQECAPLKAQWEREAGSECPNPGGYYPPPSLQSLLRSYLCDCYQEEFDNVDDDEEDDLPEMKVKHSITIYLLMDLAMLLQGTHPSVDHLIKYPSAFKLSPSLIKLTQAFWLLDHDDYDGFFKILTGELILPCDIKDWQHKFAVDSLLRNDQHKLALMYLRVLKPPLSTLEDQGTLIGLSVEQGLVESAFHARPPGHYAQLLTKFFQSCKANGKLKQILYLSLDTEEEEAFIKFLKENNCDDIKLLYYLQRCRHTEASDVFSMENTNFNSHYADQSSGRNKIHPVAQRMLSAFNATLPEVTKKFARNQCKFSSSLLANRLTNQQSEQGSVLSNGVRGYPRPFSQFRNPVKGIYEVAMSKTRETCLKSERCVSGPHYIPFLGAPCSTLVYCTRVSGSALPEPSDANSILYPEKKKGKRTIGMLHDGEEQTGSNRKRPRLGSECDRNCSNGDNNEQPIRRLSMSQVCQTPLVERKMKLTDSKDPNYLVTETPHSILKIRQMIRRSSNSPGFGFGSGSSEREAIMRRNAAGDSRPARQIRFSVDRLSANDDSAFSTTESNRDEIECNQSGSSKNTEEESCMESYYSPDVSAKSIRESSILSDSSVTKFIHGPRPRPSLRRSSMLSRASSDWQSQKGTSLDTTLEVSDSNTNGTLDNVNASTMSTHSSSPSFLYDASILSCNTTFGRSPVKRFFNQRHTEEETEESEASTEDEAEAVSKLHKESVNKHSSVQGIASSNSEMTENDEDMEQDGEEVESQHGEVENLHEKSSIRNQTQENEMSEDGDEASKKESELEEDECDQDDDTFQSFSNSTEEEPRESPVNFSHRLEESIQNETSFSLTRHSTERQNVVPCYSLTKNFALDQSLQRDESYHSGNYSLTRPIFLDNRGILRCSESVDITDDESNDPEVIVRPQLTSVKEDEDQEMEQQQKVHDAEIKEQNLDDEAELTLNLSPSEGSDEERLKKLKEAEHLSEKPRKSSFSSELSNERLSLFVQKELSTPRKESSIVSKKELSVGRRSRLSSTSSTKSENNSEEGTPLRRSARHQSTLTVKVPTPRRSIKSMSVSPSTKSEEQTERSKRGSSVTKEVKKILSKVIGEQNIPKINIEVSSDEQVSTPGKSQEMSPVTNTLESKSTRKTKPSPRPPLRESSEETIQITPKKEALSIPSEKKRSQRTSQSDIDGSTELSKPRTTRAGAIVKDTSKPTRKTRTTSVLEDTSPSLEVAEDETAAKKPGKTWASRGATATQELVSTKNITVDDDQEEIHDTTKTTKSRSTRASSQNKETVTKTTGRRTRTASTTNEEALHEDKSTGISRRTRAASVAKEDKDVPEEKSAGAGRRIRTASLAKEEEEAATMLGRRTKVVLVAQDEQPHTPVGRRTRAAPVKQDAEPYTPVGQRTRAASVTQEEEVHTPVGRRTRAASVTQDDETHPVIGRRTRAASVTQAEEEPTAVGRRTRAASVTQDDEVPTAVGRRTKPASATKNEDTSVLGLTRRTRAASLAKETAEEETKSTKRTTRATSVLSENNEEIQESTRTTRKRGNSMPKELTSAPEPTRIVPSRSRRSTSLLKEVIVEESLLQIDSPVGGRRSRSNRNTTEEMVSSPAANTRSRRSSIHVVPEVVEEVPSPRSSRNNNDPNVDENRSRRATSVDSSVITAPTGKRMTRSVLKTSIIDEIIPEEVAVTKLPTAKKQPTRRKRATSVPVDQPEEPETSEKDKEQPKAKSKRSRTAGENFLFSLPEEAWQENIDGKDDCSQSPTYKFSKPTMLQKFISPVYFGEASSGKTAMRQKGGSAGGVRRPRTCFVLTEKRKAMRTEQ